MSGKGASRTKTYEKSDDPSASCEERMTRLKFELREHIRFLADYEILSTEWLRMAESLNQIANVAFMETHLPPSDENPLKQEGKKDKGTLWDQERDELAIRILLEEGKLNLALRILHKYKALSNSSQFDKMIKDTCAKYNSDASTVIERCRVFEQSLGVLLKFALQHVETLQIMDVPEFMNHVAEVLEEAERSDKKPSGTNDEKMQETMVLHYLASLTANMEEMDEDRVMELIETNNVVSLTVNHMRKHFDWYRLDTLDASARFLNNVMNSEAFRTEPERFMKEEEDEMKKKFVDLKSFYVAELVETYGLKKRDVQTLLDHLEKFERVVGKAQIVPLKTSKSDARASKYSKK